MSRNPSPLKLDHPLDIDDARQAARRLAEQRREAEDWHETLVEEASAAEREYRKAYAKAITKAEGAVPVREAQAKADTAELAYTRDYKDRLVKVASEKLRGLEGERSMLTSLISWSSRMTDESIEAKIQQAVQRQHNVGRAA